MVNGWGLNTSKKFHKKIVYLSVGVISLASFPAVAFAVHSSNEKNERNRPAFKIVRLYVL